jgi:hypothetical protein
MIQSGPLMQTAGFRAEDHPTTGVRRSCRVRWNTIYIYYTGTKHVGSSPRSSDR